MRAESLFLPLFMLALGCGAADRQQSNRATETRQSENETTAKDRTESSDTVYREFGSGRHAIILGGVENPPTYCWYIETVRRICREDGYVSDRSSRSDMCVDDLAECLSTEPEGWVEDTDRCHTRSSWETAGNTPLFGSCEQRDAYWSDDPAVECLFHGHCADGEQCIDYQCVCPEGVQCACTECLPTRPTCDGDVLVVSEATNVCDEQDRCIYDETRTDCAALDQVCDADAGACVSSDGTGGGTGGGPTPECTVDTDCAPSPSAPGVCNTPRCVSGTCTTESVPC